MISEAKRLTAKNCILVSACLLGENCKYNGGNNYNQKLVDFLEDKTFLAVCPEVAGGLPTPRAPVEIYQGHVYDKRGHVYDQEFHQGIERVLSKIDDMEIDLAIRQPRSPSCGVHHIYDGRFSGKTIAGQGLFARKLIDLGHDVIDVDDLSQLVKGKR